MKRSISQIITNKIFDHLENQSINNLLIHLLLFFIAIMLTSFVLFPGIVSKFIITSYQYHNYAIPKIALIFAVVFNFSKIARLSCKIYKQRNLTPKKLNGDTIEGIPTVELLDHLFECKSFKREEIEKKF